MKTNKFYADEFYKKFSLAEGNQHIASHFALKKLMDILQTNRPHNILEVGLGIGSISYTIMEYCSIHCKKINYYGTEKNEYCLSQLPKNLGAHFHELQLYPELNDIPKELLFDLIIIDGSDTSLEAVKKHIAPNGIIFIEGDRSYQTEVITALFPNNLHVQLITDYKNPKHGPFDSNRWTGGCRVVYTNPTRKQLLQYYISKTKNKYYYSKRQWLYKK